MANELGVGDVERLVLEQFGHLRLGGATARRFFLLQAFGFDALLLFLLRADRIGLGQVDLLLAARRTAARARLATAGRAFAALARGTLTALAVCAITRLAGFAGRTFPALAGGFAAAFGALAPGFRVRGLEAQAQQFFTQRIAHRGTCFSSAAAEVRCRDRRTAGYATA